MFPKNVKKVQTLEEMKMKLEMDTQLPTIILSI